MTSSAWGVDRRPLIVALGGTPRAGSSTELAIGIALRAAEAAGARTQIFGGAALAALPVYWPGRTERTPEQRALVEAASAADGLIIGSPSYHGGVSGVVKNAIDLLEDLVGDTRPYLQDRAVGLIVTGAGWQATGATLSALRAIVHALRGWPTPLGATLNTSAGLFDAEGRCTSEAAVGQLEEIGRQVAGFARMARMAAGADAAVAPLKAT